MRSNTEAVQRGASLSRPLPPSPGKFAADADAHARVKWGWWALLTLAMIALVAWPLLVFFEVQARRPADPFYADSAAIREAVPATAPIRSTRLWAEA